MDALRRSSRRDGCQDRSIDVGLASGALLPANAVAPGLRATSECAERSVACVLERDLAEERFPIIRRLQLDAVSSRPADVLRLRELSAEKLHQVGAT
jgi:hypothetical protein